MTQSNRGQSSTQLQALPNLVLSICQPKKTFICPLQPSGNEAATISLLLAERNRGDFTRSSRIDTDKARVPCL